VSRFAVVLIVAPLLCNCANRDHYDVHPLVVQRVAQLGERVRREFEEWRNVDGK